MLASLTNWIGTTHLNAWVAANQAWLLPLVQTIHILCLAIVLSAVVLIGARLYRDREQTGDVVAHFVPFIWTAVAVMALTGAIMIAGEPGRALLNPVFGAKMALLVLSAAATGWLQRKPDVQHARIFAVLFVGLWIAVAICGRWIAYAVPE